jgi:hypothetical protein
MVFVGWVFTVVSIAVPLAIFRGCVFACLWKWFVAAQFGLPLVSIPMAIGLVTITSLACGCPPRPDDPDKTTAEKLAETSILNFLITAIAFGVGWVTSFFV